MNRSPWLSTAIVGGLLVTGSPALAQFAGFAEEVSYSVVDATTDCVLADLDSDGDLDFAGNSLGPATFDRAGVLLNNGDGTFGSPAFYGVGSVPLAIASADMDLDGDIDLILANRDTEDLSLLRNNGNGTFLAEIIIPVGTLPVEVAVADFNTDGRPDIAVSDSSESNVRVFFGGPDVTSWGAPNFILTSHGGGGTGGFAPNNMIARDVNLDGAPDIVTSNAGSDTLTIMYNTGSGSFFSGEFAILVDTGDNPGDLACEDMNGDGEPDLVVIDRIDNTVSVHFNNWDGGANAFPTFPSSTTIPVSGVPEGIAIADLGAEEGDGDRDLLISTIVGGVRVQLKKRPGVINHNGANPTPIQNQPPPREKDRDRDPHLLATNPP
ncbi:MAG: FG-GAP repeat domain-containing protein, partial [Phycisphaerales bacterium JB059]